MKMTDIKKLELKHIKSYLDSGLRASVTEFNGVINEIIITGASIENITGYYTRIGGIEDDYSKTNTRKIFYYNEVKPHYRPMSDLYKERNGKIDIVELAKIATGVQEWIVKEFTPVIGKMKFKSYMIAFNEKYNIRFNFSDGNFWLYDMSSATNETIANQYKLWEYLFANHYNVFDLPQELWIDINTLP